MFVNAQRRSQFHTHEDLTSTMAAPAAAGTEIEHVYKFENFFHPFVGDLIGQLNEKSLAGLLDPNYHERLSGQNQPGPDTLFKSFDYAKPVDPSDPNRRLVKSEGFPRKIDVEVGRPYSNYNWELFFHIPLTIAVHLGKNQRFAEAQRWFHFIFDPTSTEPVPAPKRFWRFLAFRKLDRVKPIDALLALLSKPNPTPQEEALNQEVRRGYAAIRLNPFQPHAVARTRQVSYQYYVVMKYLDNLIAWGDSLFRQDTMESINEATQLYILAANVLGPRPQRIPMPGRVRPQTFAQLKARPRDPLGNALVELEGKFPFNLGLPQTQPGNPAAASQLFGIGRALYFCVPPNDKLLGYWDTVADRLFKIRHCMNIEGAVRQLALYDPPIDPAVLVKAAAAGIDIATVVSGLQQPVGLVRTPLLIQKALELCGEVRGLGSALLAAIEKGDGERMALLRQGHEIKILRLQQEVRLLQWKQAQESTESLLRSRASAMERYRHYLRLLGRLPDKTAPQVLPLDRREISEANFDRVHAELVKQYSQIVFAPSYPELKLAAGITPESESEACGDGNLYLTRSEDAELNGLLPNARDTRERASTLHTIASFLTYIPEFTTQVAPIGIGLKSLVFGGTKLADALKIAAEILVTEATKAQDEAGIASRTASYERRAEDWIFQTRLAAQDLMQIGKQLIGALIGEQVTRREHANLTSQIECAQEVDRFLHAKYSNEELYGWMQGEISRLYYEYYRFAVDTARKAEQTMKRELMRPEVDATSYIRFNYWDGGRKGLLSGEALYLDIKRMEMAYHENNTREYELTKHVSLLQVDPFALLQLRATGRCTVRFPEELFDMDGPGHYFRRIKSVAVSIPCVTGPYAGVNCRLTLLKSAIRKLSRLRENKYRRDGLEDDRFIDYFGSLQAVVTSSGQNDSGMFETHLRDERFLPFEGSGVIGEWQLQLPADPSKGELAQFDYNTISDVIVHVRFTAREAGGLLRTGAIQNISDLIKESGSVRLFSARHEFPSQWANFKNPESVESEGPFTLKLNPKVEHYPFWSQGLLARGATVPQMDLIADASGPFKVMDGGQLKDVVKDPSLGLFRYRFTTRPPTPIEEISLSFNDNSMKGLWLAVTWAPRN